MLALGHLLVCKCKQYGHACLGGHGKRSDISNQHLMDYILRKMDRMQDESADISTPRRDELRSIFEKNYEKKLNDWDSYEEDELRPTLFNAFN
ncbi:uncharacterized protein LOC129989601 isoform X2 [Argiope bruennichi]|uniref:uncharacterized protein LOC129989601 isoform X2 n=1 Tax=Argiope bruennichi TaxID=94029 RepID=UPI0024955829|nr:uncharacterized protein LOC129989601 isoform X2 [Argiope bruennichi]